MSTIETVVDNWPSPNWGRIPPVTVTGPARQEGAGRILLPTSSGDLRVSLYPFGFRLRSAPRAIGGYGMLNAEPAEEPVTLATAEGQTILEGGGLKLVIGHEPFSFELTKAGTVVQRSPTDGHFVRRFRMPPLAKLDRGWFVTLDLASGEPVYGLGEKWGKLDKRGQLIRSKNEDALGVNAERSYKNVPFAWSPEGWGAFVHTPSPVTHGVGFAPWSQRAYGLLVEDEALDLFVFAGTDGADLIARYTGLTGRSPVPPLWSLGVILSKAYYKTPEEVLEVAAEVRRRGMPCDTITFDGRAWQDTDTRFTFEWDPKRFSDPGAVITKLKAMDFKVCVWEYPLVSVNNPWFAEMAAKGWLLKDRRTGEAFRYEWDLEPFGPVLTPLPASGIVDFTHPDAYAFWRDCHKPLFELGVDMIKADFGEQIEDDMQASNGETGHALHNVYAHLYNRCVYEAAERYCQSGPFLFSRASWIGAQRYPAQWGGDPQADWEGMAGNLRGGLSWGMTGAPYYATDIGGFYRDQRDAALYVRWAQAAVYSAHMRLHGIGPREPWSYGPEAEAAVQAALELRYRLVPVLHRAMEQAHATGLPVQRAMALAFPAEKAAWAFEDQFMLGDDLLVAPCTRPDGKVEVYLPQGTWHRFAPGRPEDKTAFEGGRSHKLVLPLSETAVFARAGAEIPLGPAVKHTGELGGEVRVAEVWRG